MRLLDLFVFKYNRTDFHELNLDWIISDMRTLAETLQNFISLNVITYANPIQWNITKQYKANTVVVNPNDGTAYLSVQAVPSGVAITNTDYWMPIFTLNLISANQNITLRDDGANVLATFASAVNDWLLWNGTLYKVTQAIAVNEAYVVGYNITRYTVELFLDDLKTYLVSLIGDLTALTTTDKTDVVSAINEVVQLITNLKTNVGDISDLDTTDKSNVVAAINENFDSISDLEAKISNLKIANVKDFGATGDGVTDDTQAIQDAIDYADTNKCLVYIPNGTYIISSTITIGANMTIVGQNKTGTIIKRADAMTGNTFTVSTAGSLKICNIFFLRNFVYDSSSITNKLSTACHISIAGGQEVYIVNCLFWDMPYHIKIESSSLVNIDNCNFKGSMWDSTDPNRQEGRAAICIGQNSYCQLVNIHNCYLGGGYIKSGASVTVGGTSETIDLNIGSLYGIVAYCCEGLIIDNCYIGGFNSAAIQLQPTQTILSQVRITNNFFDGCFDGGIAAISTDATKKVFDCIINNNHFNGQLCSKNGIAVLNGSGSPVIDRAIISSNVFENYLLSGMWLCATVGLLIRNNQLTSYNCKNSNPANPNYNSGIYAGYVGGKISCQGNSYGGGVNGTEVSSYCVNGIYYGATGFGTAANEIDFGVSGALITNSD